jgi:hypothetical protein
VEECCNVVPVFRIVHRDVAWQQNDAVFAVGGCGGSQSGRKGNPKPSDLESMVKIPAGEFVMGRDGADPDEGPQRKVQLSEYYIERTEVTNGQYKAYCDATQRLPPRNPEWDDDYFLKGPDLPVVNLTWNQAHEYCAWAGKRLPTVAEWEKAARGTDANHPWAMQGGQRRESARRTVRESCTGGQLAARCQPLWRARHGRQCVGVVRRLVRVGVLRQSAAPGSARARRTDDVARRARRRLHEPAHRCRDRESQQERTGSHDPSPRLSLRVVALKRPGKMFAPAPAGAGAAACHAKPDARCDLDSTHLSHFNA